MRQHLPGDNKMETQPIPDDVKDEIRKLLSDYRAPRYTYWKGPRGEMYCYSTEPLHGKFICWTYKPFGAGARSGKPENWKMTDRVEFSRRKVAKARAYSRYLKSKKESE
jgi:hypothetical protein